MKAVLITGGIGLVGAALLHRVPQSYKPAASYHGIGLDLQSGPCQGRQLDVTDRFRIARKLVSNPYLDMGQDLLGVLMKSTTLRAGSQESQR